MVQHAACLGIRCKHKVLSAAAGLSPIELDLVLRELLDTRILKVNDETIEFRHDLFRQAVWSSIGAPTRRALHLRSARALTRYSGSASEISVHLSRAGQRRRAYAFALRAARASEAVYALRECADLLEFAIQHAPADSSTTQLAARLGRIYLHIRDYYKARPWLEKRLELLNTLQSPNIERIKAQRDLVVVDTYSSRIALSETIAGFRRLHEELSAIDKRAPTLEAEILASLFWAAARSLKPRITEDAIHKIRALHSRCREPTVKCRTARSLGIFACYKGNLDEAEEYLREGLIFARNTDDEVAIIDAYIGLTILLPRRPDVTLAQEVLEEALPLAQRHADPARTVAILCNCSACFMYLGELEHSECLLAQAKHILETNDDVPDMTPSVFYNLGYVAREKGLKNSESLFERALHASEATGMLPIRVESLAALGLEALRRGDVERARDLAARALRSARNREFLLDDRSGLQLLLARLRHKAGKVEKALQRLADAAIKARDQDIPLYFTAQLARLDMLIGEGRLTEALGISDEIRAVAASSKAHGWINRTEQLVNKLWSHQRNSG